MDVLIVDSNKKDAEELIIVLSGWNHSAVHAADTALAVETAKSSVFEVILIELTLNDPDRYRMIPDLKLYNPGASILTMVSRSTPALEKKARERGIAFYMGKPLDRVQLKQIFDQLSLFHQGFGDWKKVTH